MTPLLLDAMQWLSCSQCISLVRANVYNEQFTYHLFLMWLPLVILAIIIAFIYRS